MDSPNKKLISLIICAYNEEKYIGDCLRQAIEKSNGGLHEIIVVDNASTDQTRKIAEGFPGIKVVYEPRKGLTRARQKGLLEARGEILAYIDADTRMPEGWLEKVISEFGKNEKLVSLSGPYAYYDIPKWKKIILEIFCWRILSYPVYLIVGYMILGGNFVIRKDVLEKMGGFNTSIEFYGEDTNIARRAHRFGKVKFKPSFFIYSSARRFSNQGLLKTLIVYTGNFFSEAFARRPLTKVYKDIR